MGTASYMSPEQIRGESIDQRSDIFSFGVLLYEMLTGRLPFQREDDQAVMFAILYDTPSPLGTVRPEIPSELEAVVEKALEKEKEKRHQSVDELLAELQELQRKMAAGEARPFSGRKKLKWRRQAKTARHRGAFLYGSMAILYKRKLTSLLSLQEELAQEITAKLRLKLTGEEKKRLAERYTENVEAYQLYLKGRYFWNQYEVEGGEKAIACFQQAIAIDSAYALAYAGLADAYLLYWGLGLVYIHKGMYEEAISTLQKAKTLLNERHGCVAAQGYAYAQLGNRSQALNCLQELQEMANKDYVPPFLFATLYAGLDEKDKVLEYLEKAYEDRNWQLSILKVEPIFNPLRSEPRFIAIMKKVGLE
jgi:tetratricopeptide (TPR) repeat protein